MAGIWRGRSKKRWEREGGNGEARKSREINACEKISGKVGDFLTVLDFRLRSACKRVVTL